MIKIRVFLLVALLLLTGCQGTAVKNQITSASDLNKSSIKIGVAPETQHEQVARDNIPNAKVLSFASISDMLAALKSQKVNAIGIDSCLAGFVASNDNTLKILPERFGATDVVAVVKKDNSELLSKLNIFIDSLNSDGSLSKMYDEWISQNKKQVPDLPDLTSPTQKIKVATSGTNEPTSFYINNRLSGFNIEFWERFSRETNIEIEFVTMDFNEMPAALASNKVDAISSFYKMDEIAQNVSYTKTLFVIENVYMVYEKGN